MMANDRDSAYPAVWDKCADIQSWNLIKRKSEMLYHVHQHWMKPSDCDIESDGYWSSSIHLPSMKSIDEEYNVFFYMKLEGAYI